MRSFEYVEPRTVSEATLLLAEKGNGARILAGGTDLLVQMKHDLVRPSCLVNLKSIPNLDYIALESSGGMRFGSLARISTIVAHECVREMYPALHQSARVLASPLVRNRATLGGNLCNASPSADTAPALLLYEAMVKIAGPDGERAVRLDEFLVGPGKNCLRPGEILVEVELPAPITDCKATYLKHALRKSNDIATVSVAAMVATGSGGEIAESRIALGAVAPTPIRARMVEAELRGKRPSSDLFEKAGVLAESECRPISDIRGSAWYRKQMVRVLTERVLSDLLRGGQN